jgi:hypothetical protein
VLGDIAPFLDPFAQLGASGFNLPNQRDTFRICASTKGARQFAEGFQFALNPRLNPSRVILGFDAVPKANLFLRERLDILHLVEKFFGF